MAMVMRIMKSTFIYIILGNEVYCERGFLKEVCAWMNCGLGIQSQFNWNQYNKRQKGGKLFYFYSTALFLSMKSSFDCLQFFFMFCCCWWFFFFFHSTTIEFCCTANWKYLLQEQIWYELECPKKIKKNTTKWIEMLTPISMALNWVNRLCSLS